EKQHQFEELVKQKERDHELATKLEESLKELKAVNERLSESNRLKDEVLSICAHDVRSPLTAIVSYTQLLLTDDQLNERHRRQIEHIHRSSEKINNLVENLLLRARYLEASEPLTIELLSIAMLAKDAVNQVQDRILAKSLKIDIVEDWNGKVYADRFKLAQVFDNLLDNATKFTPEHGEIKIRISSSTEDGGVATITISNSGKGIAAEDIPRLFLKYFQTNSGQQQSGYGLGLAICRKNIELHGGKIEVESIPDEKTLFRFTIPIGSCNSISD
ncbi:MAG: GHKL domain-containing protein, partial [Blastocatellia bacterium]|nr:GHKL domain-containing protein [Blastocatellia bacterium]